MTSKYVPKVREVLRKYKAAIRDDKLLELSFTTIYEYLWMLRSACQALAILKQKCILYLAAAVSDFYIPPNEMVLCFIYKTNYVQIALVDRVLNSVLTDLKINLSFLLVCA